MTIFLAKAKVAAVAAIAGALTIAAAPANAEAAHYAVRGASPAAGTVASEGADRQFQQLYASWERNDSRPASTSVSPTVSVPSRTPLDDFRMTSSYGMREHPVLGGWRQHKGMDMAAPSGTPVYATADGVVGKAEWFSSYGNYIQIEHGADLETRFGHLSRIAVSAGQRVQKGDLIGYVGSTGRSTGPHLHYEVRVDGVAVDPSNYMNERSGQRAFAMAMGGSK